MSEFLERQRMKKEQEAARQTAGLSQGAMDAIRDFTDQGGQISPAMAGMIQQGGPGPAAMDAMRDFAGQGGTLPPQMAGMLEADAQRRAQQEAEAQQGPKVTKERVMEANRILLKYKSARAKLEQRLVENEKWWDARGWSTMQEMGNPGSAKRPTMWLFNVIMGKHADMMEAYPEPVILPREEGDDEEARKLTAILPVVLEQADFEETYNMQAWEKNKHGTGCYGIFWNKEKLNGLGDIDVEGIDLLSLFWEPDIQDIEESQNVFLVTPQDEKMLKRQYPELQDENLHTEFTLKQYQTEINDNKTEKVAVVDWYYHTYEGGKKLLQYCKYCGTHVLYASEDDEQLQGRGWYDDGEYPFVLDRLYPRKGSPAGKGYIDLGRNAQEEIDLLNQAILINARAGAIPRWLVGSDASINETEFLDFTNPFVHVMGTVNEYNLMQFPSMPLNGNYIGVLNNKIEELKQVLGNQDVTNGITNGVTAASGIAAQMEAAGRSSRDANKGTYRAYSKILLKVIERIRQFYDAPRQFRILGENGDQTFTSYTNAGLQMQPQLPVGGMDMGLRKPQFDIKVSAQKQNPYSKMSNNELMLQLLSAGVFTPQMADQSTLLLSMMDFPKKDELLKKVQGMGQMMREMAMWQQMAMQLAQKYEPETAQQMAQQMLGEAGLPAGGAPVQAQEAQPRTEEGVKEDKRMRNAREQSRNVSQVE